MLSAVVLKTNFSSSGRHATFREINSVEPGTHHDVKNAVKYIILWQAYWTGTSYMGETTGAFFSYAVEFSLAFHEERPRYQPFSVYKDYPGVYVFLPLICVPILQLGQLAPFGQHPPVCNPSNVQLLPYSKAIRSLANYLEPSSSRCTANTHTLWLRV